MFFKQWKTMLGITFSKEMAYKTNFLIKMLMLIFLESVGPIISYLIYENTLGIPGWSFEEFILLLGTFTLIINLANFLFLYLPSIVMFYVKKGFLDTLFVKPMNLLAHLTIKSINLEAIAGILTGLVLIIWSFLKLELSLFSINFMFYILLIFIAVIFQFSLIVIMASLTIIFIKITGLYHIYNSLMSIAKYPLIIFNSGLILFFTFIIPIGIAAHYPVTVLLGEGIKLLTIGAVIIVIIFLFISILLWKYALKKYSSAGG